MSPSSFQLFTGPFARRALTKKTAIPTRGTAVLLSLSSNQTCSRAANICPDRRTAFQIARTLCIQLTTGRFSDLRPTSRPLPVQIGSVFAFTAEREPGHEQWSESPNGTFEPLATLINLSRISDRCRNGRSQRRDRRGF